MFNTSSTQHLGLARFRLSQFLTPLAIGIGVLSTAMAVEARPIIIQSSPSPGIIYGNPVPTPFPVYSTSPRQPNYPYDDRDDYDYRDYDGIRRPVRNPTLINPIVIDSEIRDSILINPVIIESPSRGRRRVSRSRIPHYPR